MLVSPVALYAQIPVTAATNQQHLLSSADPKTAANKRLVYDFWREIIEAGHLELAGKYLSESYIQHNPVVPNGRAGFVSYFSQMMSPHEIDTHIKAPVVSIVADDDMVVISFVAEVLDHKGTYTSTWFDMFRVENGKIAEHWDPMLKQSAYANPAEAEKIPEPSQSGTP